MQGTLPFIRVASRPFLRPIARRALFVRTMRPWGQPLQTVGSPVVVCFYTFAAFCVLPFFDLPLLGLSLTAPLFLVVAGAAVLKTTRKSLTECKLWVWFTALIFFGLLVGSLAHLDVWDLLSAVGVFLHFGYWLLVFLGTAYFASTSISYTRLAAVLATSVSVLALLRLFEALFFGKVGAWSGLVFQTQNNYAILFSSFSPFLLVFLVSNRWSRRLYALLGLALVWTAVALNGSRGGWAGLAVGTLLFVVIFTCTKPGRAWLLWLGLGLVTACVAVSLMSSEEALTAFTNRASTLGSLDNEKSFKVRRYLNKKSCALFLDSPVFGVGLGRYRETPSRIEVPDWYKGNESEFDRKSSHNSYLCLLAETGLAGGVPFGLLLLSLAILGGLATIRLTRKGQIWALGIYVSLCSMAVHMWVISCLTNTATWFVYGLTASIIVVARRPQPALLTCRQSPRRSRFVTR